MHIEIAPSRAKLLSSRGTTLELYCLASTDIRLSSAREPSRAITLRQSPARRSRVSRERLASFVTFLVSGTVFVYKLYRIAIRFKQKNLMMVFKQWSTLGTTHHVWVKFSAGPYMYVKYLVMPV